MTDTERQTSLKKKKRSLKTLTEKTKKVQLDISQSNMIVE